VFFHERDEIRDPAFESAAFEASAFEPAVTAILSRNAISLFRAVN
jgi:hypothetical protein